MVTALRKERSGGSKSTALAVDFGRNVVSGAAPAAQCAWHTGQDEVCFQAHKGRRSVTEGQDDAGTEETRDAVTE